MKIRCPYCAREHEAFYWQLGLPSPCPSCHQELRLRMANVLELGTSGWSVTFWEFVRLAGEPTYDADIQPLLSTFGYERIQEKPLHFRDASGKNLTAEEAHTQIQTDETRQYHLYQAAMTLWR